MTIKSTKALRFQMLLLANVILKGQSRVLGPINTNTDSTLYIIDYGRFFSQPAFAH